MRRGGAVACLALCASALVVAPARAETPFRSEGAPIRRILIRGIGAAHGLGMAMDGVEGQARAGWSHDKILDLFYPGTSTGRFGGTIRVGLADGARQSFTLPGGGTARTAAGSMSVPVGGELTVVLDGGRAAVRVENRPSSTPAAAPTPEPTAKADERRTPLAAPGNPLESPPPPPALTPLPTPTSEPEPTPASAPQKAPPVVPPDASVHIVPAGDPAVTEVEATGRKYRGVIEVRPAGGSLRVVNHVDLETYVAGIAEEKGAGWPLEGLKTLAVAARSLGAATMTWYGRNRANGYDICPTQNCQVYLGYDGEEPLMRRAVAETAGQIRTYKGTPILAMYHGNGGGQTESYHRVARTKTNPHPYLTSVRYPYADPSEWRREETPASIGAALAAHGDPTPGKIERIQVLERGDSPRVIQLRLHGTDGYRDMTGTTFAAALDLWSTWFYIGESGRLPALTSRGARATGLGSAPAVTGDVRPWGFLVVLAVAVAALAIATTLVTTSPQTLESVRIAWPPLRVAPAPSPPGS